VTTDLFKGFVSLVLGSVFVRGVGFAATAILMRVFGPSEFGTFTVGLTLAVLFALCVNPGLDDFLVREIARAPSDLDWQLGDAVLVRLPALPLAVAAGLLAESTAHAGGGMYLLLAVYGAGYAYLQLTCALLRGHGRMRAQAGLLSAQMGAIAVASSVACTVTQSIVWVAAIYAGATIIALVCGYTLLHRIGIRPRYGWRPDSWLRLARANLTFAVTVIGVLVLDRQALVMVGLLRDQADAGWFGSVYNLVLALANLPVAAAAVALPQLTRLAQRGIADLERLASQVVRYTTLVSVPLAVALYVTAPVGVPLLYGPQYQPSVTVLQVIAFGIPPVFLTVVLISVLEAADRQRGCAASVLQSLLVASPVVLAATWRFGLEGAAAGYVVSHLVLATLLMRRTQQALGWRWFTSGLGSTARRAIAERQ